LKGKKISHFVTMGDSLTDRGTLNKEMILGCIPMSLLSGLQGKSPRGRFSDGYVWSDYLSSMVAEELLIQELKQKGKTDEDIADAIATHRREIEKRIAKGFNLNDDSGVEFEGHPFIRTFGEGGMTAHDYSWMPSTSITRFFSRLVLSTLTTIRRRLFQDDHKHQVSKTQKAQTLVMEWSGANDLITVNARPSMEEVEDAVRARVQNAEAMIKKGYQHFVLFNLPDLSLTPRYQAMSQAEQDNARACVEEFNRRLELAAMRLNALYPHCSVEVFDVKKVFDEVYHNPAHFGFDADKRKVPYTSVEKADAKHFMFWDDVHPSAHMHAILAQRFYTRFNSEFQFIAPESMESQKADILQATPYALFRAFEVKYSEKLQADRLGFFNQFRRVDITFLQNLRAGSYEDRLVAIIKHALHEGGMRSREALMELRWIDKHGQLKLHIPALQAAMEKVNPSPLLQSSFS
jgi:hypothetical protein